MYRYLFCILGRFVYGKYVQPTLSPTTQFPSPAPSGPSPSPTLVPTDRASSLVWRGGANLRYIEDDSGLEISGDAGSCSGGRGFETALASYGGEVDAIATFMLSLADDNSMYPSLSVFPVQSSFSTGACSGRIAVMLLYRSFWGYGELFLLGERLQLLSHVNNLQVGAQYTLRLVHSLQQGQTRGYLYGPVSGSGSGPLIASTSPISEVFASSVKVGFADSRQRGWTALSSLGVNGSYDVCISVIYTLCIDT